MSTSRGDFSFFLFESAQFQQTNDGAGRRRWPRSTFLKREKESPGVRERLVGNRREWEGNCEEEKSRTMQSERRDARSPSVRIGHLRRATINLSRRV